MVIRDLMKERENSYKMEIFHESREMALKVEIAELKGKVMEQELRNDYLSSQLLEACLHQVWLAGSLQCPGG
jgi:hypothetical protein